MTLQQGAESQLLPAIPLEIQFLILDQLYTGSLSRRRRIANLSPLALTCFAWAGHIQPLLFRNISLNKCNTDAFLSLLRRNGRLGEYVLAIFLPGGARVILNPDLVRHLPNVHTIRVTSHSYMSLVEPHRPWVTVRTLSLSFCILSTAQDLWAFIDLFPALESLECGGWMYARGDMRRQLAARQFTVDSFSVSLATEEDRDASPCNALLSRIGPTLQVLDVTELPEELAPSESAFIPLDISNCTALRHLTLRLHHSTASPTHMNTGLISFLHQIPSGPLTTLTLETILAAPLLELQWDVDGILSAYTFRDLENIAIRVRPASSTTSLTFGEVKTHLESRMAGLRQLGLLQVEHVEL
ncbi:hypothetical protein B0H16DRAFT_1763548 [Mycena metata]|uniref:Uncharacterized protein n=1 Tax=Mycena metata TaxID=1033252 RepID=A0AAD7JXK6_9AGAR|nr:hypothetical protein B0H16DRAFT_1763548 [Mycena metata]